jgi:hypothetical protein
MDSNVYTYIQKRSNFGKTINFIDSKKVYELFTWPVVSWDKENTFFRDNAHERRDPNFVNLSNIPDYSENIVRSVYPRSTRSA